VNRSPLSVSKSPDLRAEQPVPARLASIDAYRGFVMFLLMAEVLRFADVARALPASGFWHFLATHQEHAEWAGCTLHDLIQPSFSFLVGVALPFSLASRIAHGQSPADLAIHTIWRSLLLVFLGIFLRSAWGPQTYWTFEDTVTQIGLGYPILFLLGLRTPRAQWVAFAVIVVGYWAAWAIYPLPGLDFDFTSVSVPADWSHHATGFAAHWNKNANLGTAFDHWFLNLFPRVHPFIAHDGGYGTLNCIPTLGTMILGLIAGRWLMSGESDGQRIKRLFGAGLVCLLLGLVAQAQGICPIVKRIWTPSWTLFSGGCCFWLLAGFYSVMDWAGWKRWAFPLRVIGMNSIAAYIITWLLRDPIFNQLKIHFGTRPFALFGDAYAPLLLGIVALFVQWLILFWMHRRKIFLKI
jgi:heparan-alpha-glucosaminide N-acetyltransferase